MAEYTDPLARTLVELAVAMSTPPVLSSTQVDTLMQLAETEGSSGTVYTSESLNKAVATGWRWKAAMVSNQYQLGGGPGQDLKRQQRFDQAMRMAALYNSGEWTVDSLSPSAIEDDEGDMLFFVGDFLSGEQGGNHV